MTNPSPDDLLGYVLGALDADQQRDLQEKIDRDPQLEQQLLDVKSGLLPLELLDEPAGIRPGLARRTCEAVASFENASADTEFDSEADAKPLPAHRDTLLPGSSWSRNDLIVAVACVGVLAAVLFPVVSHTRYQSQITRCGGNLSEIGFALASYSDAHEGDLIDIPPAGPMAFAGSFATKLKEQKFIEDDGVFVCSAVSRDEPFRVPSTTQITHCAAGPDYDRLRRNASGDYGYTIGHFENNRYQPPRNLGRSHRIVCADKPSARFIGGPSDNHRGNGQNCLFEDGHVEFVAGPSRGNDSIYVNHFNIVGPGVSADDSVIGPSHLTPSRISLLNIRVTAE